MKKIIIYGGNGLLGSEIVKELSPKYTLIAPSHNELDVTDKKALRLHLHLHKPDYIIYAVGITRIDQAEADPTLASLLNTKIPEYIAKIAKTLAIPIIYFSSDAVFDNSRIERPFKETDTPSAASLYGKSKLLGEKAVLLQSNKNIILRVVMLYTTNYIKKQDFVRRIIAALKNNASVEGIVDQYVSPLFVPRAVKALEKIIASNVSGIYHLASTDITTNYDFIKKIANILKLNENLISPIFLKDFLKNKKIHRAQYAALDVKKFESEFGKDVLQTTDKDLLSFKRAIIKNRLLFQD